MLDATNAEGSEGVLDALAVPYCVHADELAAVVNGLCKGDTGAVLSSRAVPFGYGDAHPLEQAAHQACMLLDYYLDEPTLIDPYIPEWVPRLCAAVLKPTSAVQRIAAAHVLYGLCKVRGAGSILPFMPCAVEDLVPVFILLSTVLSTLVDEWTLRYVVLLMASAILHVPMDLSRFARRFAEARDGEDWSAFLSMLHGSACALLGMHACRERDAAVRYVAALLRRRDAPPNIVGDIVSAASSVDGAAAEGALSVLARVAKDDIGALLRTDGSVLARIAVCLCTHDRSTSTSLRRVCLKLWPRVACASVLSCQTADGGLGNKSIGPCIDSSSSEMRANSALADAQSAIYAGLACRDTGVRWTAAKALSALLVGIDGSGTSGQADAAALKLLERARVLLDDMEGGVLSDPAALHGVAMALGEMLRRGALSIGVVQSLLFGQHWPTVFVRMLTVDVPRGRLAVGAAIRDAACLISWAAARFYPAEVVVGCVGGAVNEKTPLFARALLCAAVFDREVGCRRAAAAALQEVVGRWGEAVVPRGIALLGHVSYFAIGRRADAYGRCARLAATEHIEYACAFVEHVLARPLCSWDRGVREQASAVLPDLLSILLGSADFLQSGLDNVLGTLLARSWSLDDVAVQHGALLSLARIMGDARLAPRVLGVRGPEIFAASAMLADPVRAVPSRMLGWDLVACAAMEFVCSMASMLRRNAQSERPDAVDGSGAPVDLWLESVLLALGSRDDSLHIVAVEALKCVVLILGEGAASDMFRGRILPAADKDRNVHMQRGCALAIGAMPFGLARDRRAPLGRLLARMVCATSQPVEKRANALSSLIALLPALCEPEPAVSESERVISVLRNAVLLAIDDHGIDARGDVGSMLRETVLCALGTLRCGGCISGRSSEVCSECDALCERAECLLSLGERELAGYVVQHVYDRLDRLRHTALRALASNVRLVRAIFKAESVPWASFASSADVFAGTVSFAQALREADEKMYSFVLCGAVSSAGSQSVSLSVPAVRFLCAVHTDVGGRAGALCAALCVPRLLRAVVHAFVPVVYGDARTLARGIDASASDALGGGVDGDVMVAETLPETDANAIVRRDGPIDTTGEVDRLCRALAERAGGASAADALVLARAFVRSAASSGAARSWLSSASADHACMRVREISLSAC